MEKEIMRNRNIKAGIFRLRFDWMLVSVVFAMLLSCARPGVAQQSAPKMFSSPEEACRALFQAAQNNDERTLANILGAGKALTASGDEDEDKLDREGFAEKVSGDALSGSGAGQDHGPLFRR